MNALKPTNGVPQPANILVVDDTPANLQVLAGMLKDRGYKVRPVPSGKLALSAAQRDPPDLILLDINMPDMNGYEVCERLKADEKLKGIPIIFISALTEPLDKVKAFAIGGVDYLTKPFQMEELHARVETHLKLRRLQIDLEEYSRDLEQARVRIDLDLKLARGVQRSFLPARMPQVTGYEFFAYYEPVYEIGGDYYDFIPLAPHRTAVLLGDVVGKGVMAALVMAKLSADARFCMLTEADPATAITKLNVLMNESGIPDQFATLVAAVLDSEKHLVTIINAGHPPPLLYKNRTHKLCEAITNENVGVPLGVVDGFKYTSEEFVFEAGDCIVAFTDGVTEAMNCQSDQLEARGLYAALQADAYTPKTLVEKVISVAKQHATGCGQSDDIASVSFGRTGQQK